MEDCELRDQLMTLLLAGHETTATGLAWTFDLLLHHPDALARLEVELGAGEREYLDAVIEESLRVRPVVPFTGRLYPEPYAFRPERMLAEGAPETYSWIPFGGGTRRCLGAAFAQMEMRIAIETILRSVTLRAASPDLEKPIRRNVTLSPANGTRVVASARS
jgi:cytochrome P450